MEVRNPSEFDIRCSNACTRAGLAALLLSAVAVALLQPLEKTQQLNEVLGYYGNRLAMADALNQLEKDPVWKFLKSSSVGAQAAKTWTLGQLLEYKVLDDGKSLRLKTDLPALQLPKTESKKSLSPPTSPPAAPGMAPTISPPTAPVMSPTNLSVSLDRTIDHLHYIATALTDLADGSKLSLARQYSNRHNREIFRWTRLRSTLIAQNAAKGNVPINIPGPAGNRFYVPEIQREMLLKYLTMPQIIELINYEPVREYDLDPLLKEQSSLTVPSVGIPLTAIRAASLLEMALVLMTLYFWLYYREAKTSEHFPAPATLFAVFARTSLSRFIFNLLLLVPPAAAGLLANKSFWITPGNVVPAALVVLIALMIALEGTPTPKHGTN